MRQNKSVIAFPGKKQKRWNGRRFLLFAGLLCVLFLFFIMAANYWNYHCLARERDQYNAEVQMMENENNELKEEIVRLQEYEYIEFLARRYLNLAKPDDEQ